MNPTTLFFFVFVLIALIVIGAKSILMIRDDERAVVFRLEKFLGVQSPGLTMIVPFIDKVVKVKVDQIAGSNQMTEEQLVNRITEIYTNE